MMSRTYQFRTHIDALVKDIEQEFPNTPVCREKRLVFDEDAIVAIQTGKQSYAIRFRPHRILVPEGLNGGPWTPYYVAKAMSRPAKAGYICINEIGIARAAELLDYDARQCGFLTQQDMIRRISAMHRHQVQDDDVLSLYRLARLWHA